MIRGLRSAAGNVDAAVVLVFGSINVDVVVHTPRLPAPGETLIGSTVDRLPGGKGANQAVALARLGAIVSIVGAVGDDPDGALSVAALQGVDVTAVRTVDRPTGLALITVDRAGENTIVVVPGANELAVAPAPGGPAEALVVQLELPLAVVAAAVAGACGLVVLNAAPAQPLPAALLAQVDVLVVNESEALVLSGAASVQDALATLLHQVRRGVVVTLGAAGCLVGCGSGEAGAVVRVAGHTVPAVDTVGAGDAFVAALTWALLQGCDLPDAAVFGCAAGAFTVTGVGARSSPSADELQQFLARQPAVRRSQSALA